MERVPLKLLHTNPDGNRKPGRPKSRWKDAIESDLKTLRVSDWKTLARNRSGWRRILEEAKTNNSARIKKSRTFTKLINFDK